MPANRATLGGPVSSLDQEADDPAMERFMALPHLSRAGKVILDRAVLRLVPGPAWTLFTGTVTVLAVTSASGVPNDLASLTDFGPPTQYFQVGGPSQAFPGGTWDVPLASVIGLAHDQLHPEHQHNRLKLAVYCSAMAALGTSPANSNTPVVTFELEYHHRIVGRGPIVAPSFVAGQPVQL